MITFLATVLLLSLSPEFRLVSDRRQHDQERYVAVCAYLYQRPETMTCVEVQR